MNIPSYRLKLRNEDEREFFAWQYSIAPSLRQVLGQFVDRMEFAPNGDMLLLTVEGVTLRVRDGDFLVEDPDKPGTLRVLSAFEFHHNYQEQQ